MKTFVQEITFRLVGQKLILWLYVVYIISTIFLLQIQLPAYIENVRDKLAENLHEIWAASKIEQGWSYGEVRDDPRKKNPSINNFEKVPMTEKKYVITVSFETLRYMSKLVFVNELVLTLFRKPFFMKY